MNFYRFQSSHDCYRRMCKSAKIPEKPSFKEYYEEALGVTALEDERFKISHNQIWSEYKWYKLGQPYYNLHPGLINTFSKNKLDFPARYVSLPYLAMVVQFAEDLEELRLDATHQLRACLIAQASTFFDTDSKQVVDADRLTIWMDFGERRRMSHGDDIILLYRQLAWTGDETVEEAMTKLPIHPSYFKGLLVPEDKIALCLKLVLSIAFLAKDDSPIIVPHILNKDKEQYSSASTEERQKLHRKATEERGRKGYLVGNAEMFDLGYVGPTKQSNNTQSDRELKFAHIVAGHWQLVRYGPKKEFGRIKWIMPYVRGEGKPFKHEPVIN